MITRALERFFDWEYSAKLITVAIVVMFFVHIMHVQWAIVDAHQEERATRKHLTECLQREATP